MLYYIHNVITLLLILTTHTLSIYIYSPHLYLTYTSISSYSPIQRWNHHRLSASQHSDIILYDITDNTTFGICARCQETGLHETATHCIKCGYHLGPASSYAIPADPQFCPAPLSSYSYLVYECKFAVGGWGTVGKKPLPFRVEGDCPVVVTAILCTGNSTDNNNNKSSGTGSHNNSGNNLNNMDIPSSSAMSYDYNNYSSYQGKDYLFK